MQSVDVLVQLVVSAKSAGLARYNQYAFRVQPAATKGEIKKAIEAHYGVEVVSVTTSRFRQAPRRQSRKRIENPGGPQKKAYVQLKEGQSIRTEVGGA